MEALRALIGELGLGANIELLGTRRDVPELMRESDLMVNSSLFEGLPIALIEAAMSALPVVATDVGGSGEIVAPDVNGLLVPPGDQKALARAILAILREEDGLRSEEQTVELKSLMRISYAVFCLKKTNLKPLIHIADTAC